jgi:hypothetical protein
MAVAADLAAAGAAFRNDVGRLAAGDRTDIQGRFVIEAALLQFTDGTGGDRDRMDAQLR